MWQRALVKYVELPLATVISKRSAMARTVSAQVAYHPNASRNSRRTRFMYSSGSVVEDDYRGSGSPCTEAGYGEYLLTLSHLSQSTGALMHNPVVVYVMLGHVYLVNENVVKLEVSSRVLLTMSARKLHKNSSTPTPREVCHLHPHPPIHSVLMIRCGCYVRSSILWYVMVYEQPRYMFVVPGVVVSGVDLRWHRMRCCQAVFGFRLCFTTNLKHSISLVPQPMVRLHQL